MDEGIQSENHFKMCDVHFHAAPTVETPLSEGLYARHVTALWAIDIRSEVGILMFLAAMMQWGRR